MRVLINTRPIILPSKTGIGYHVFNVYKGLQESGITVFPTVEVKSEGLISSLSHVSSRLRAVLTRYYPSLLNKVGEIIVGSLTKETFAALPCDIYHETEFEPIPKVDAKRIVFNIYDLSVIRYPHFFKEDVSKRRADNIVKNAKMANRILVNTNYIKDEVIDTLRVKADSIDVIPLAPSISYHRIEPKFRTRNITDRFTKKDYLLCVSTIEPRKNLKTLMRAFMEIKKGYDLALVVVGDYGWLYEDIIAYHAELAARDDIRFTGYVHENTLLHLYNNALCLVYPSFYEGFGMPPLEAMSCGVPVVLSDIPPLREVAGDAAIFFRPYDYNELSDVLVKVITSEDLREVLGSKGLARARQYSWHQSVRLVVESYKKALSA